MLRNYLRWGILFAIFILSCQKVIKTTKMSIDAQTSIYLGWWLVVETNVRLTTSTGSPISGATVILSTNIGSDTLTEEEPGLYRLKYGFIDPLPDLDTINLYVDDRGDTVSIIVPSPYPQFIEIVSPTADTIMIDEPLTVIWRPVNRVNFYEVDVLNLPDSVLIFQERLTDTTVVIPGNTLRNPGDIVLRIKAVNGPQLEGDELSPNVKRDNWEGIYSVEVIQDIILHITSPRRFSEKSINSENGG